MYGSIFIQICAVGSKRRIFSAPVCILVVQGRSGSSKVDDFGTNRKRVCNFLLELMQLIGMQLPIVLTLFVTFVTIYRKRCDRENAV